MKEFKELTSEDLQPDLIERGQGRLVEHADTAHFLHLNRVHPPAPNRLQYVAYRRRLLEGPLEEVCAM